MNRKYLASLYRLAGLATFALAAVSVVKPNNANW